MSGRPWAARASAVLLAAGLLLGPLAFGAVENWARQMLLGTLFLAGILALSRRLLLEGVGSAPVFTPFLFAVFAIAQCIHTQAAGFPSSLGPWTADSSATRGVAGEFLAFSLGAVAFERAVLESRGRILAWCILVSAAAVAVVGIAQAAYGNTAYFGLRPVRHGHPFGPYVNYNHAATLMGMSVMLGLGLLGENVTVKGEKSEVYARRAMIVFLTLLCSVGTVWSRSRAGILALAVVVTAWTLVRFKTWYVGLLIAVAWLAIVGITIRYGPAHRFDAAGMLHSLDFRADAYRGGYAQFSDFPVFGSGLGAFSRVYPAYQPPPFSDHYEHLHNDFLELAAEAGVIGLVVLAAGLFSTVKMGASVLRSQKGLAVGALGACVVFVLHSLVDFSFHITANAVTFMAAWAIVAGHECA